MTAVAQPYQTDFTRHQSQTPDSIDRELDWMISNEEGQRNAAADASETNSKETDNPSSPKIPVVTETRLTPSPAHSPTPDVTSPTAPQAESHRTADTPSPQEGRDRSKSPDGLPQESPHGSPQSSPPVSPKGSPRGSPSGSPPGSPREPSSSTPDDDLHMTEDQQQANAELNHMKLDLGYTADEEPPDYDVAEKVRQLNEELANEPSPDEDRERSIKFKDNLVDLVAPPPQDVGTDDEGTDSQSKQNAADSEDDTTPRTTTDSESEAATPRSQDGEEKILVERNGTFELLSADELSPEERELYCVPAQNSNETNSRDPRPPNGPRPQTANGSSSRSNGEGYQRRRVQSAKPASRSEWDEEYTYKSPYAMTPDHRKELARKKREEDKKKQREEEEKEKEESQRMRDNNDAFLSWLRRKQERHSEEKREERNQRKREEEEKEENRDSDGAYKDWVQVKKEQHKKAREQEKKQQNEIDEGWYVRPRKDCDRAFREWLKKKNAEIKKQQNEDKQRSRIHKLLARRSRKSQQLARAIKQAQAYRYVDYYGYRF